jgi:hypothetical protein
MATLYHGTREFEGFDPKLDKIGLGFFMTADREEAFDRYCTEDDGIVLELTASFTSPIQLESVIEKVVEARLVEEKLDELRREAAESGYSLEQAACRREFGRGFNETVRDYAIVNGHDALLVDDWVIALDTSKLAVTRIYDVEGCEVEQNSVPALS